MADVDQHGADPVPHVANDAPAKVEMLQQEISADPPPPASAAPTDNGEPVEHPADAQYPLDGKIPRAAKRDKTAAGFHALFQTAA